MPWPLDTRSHAPFSVILQNHQCKKKNRKKEKESHKQGKHPTEPSQTPPNPRKEKKKQPAAPSLPAEIPLLTYQPGSHPRLRLRLRHISTAFTTTGVYRGVVLGRLLGRHQIPFGAAMVGVVQVLEVVLLLALIQQVV